MKKYIINDTVYACETIQPHGLLRSILIDAQMNNNTIEIEED